MLVRTGRLLLECVELPTLFRVSAVLCTCITHTGLHLVNNQLGQAPDFFRAQILSVVDVHRYTVRARYSQRLGWEGAQRAILRLCWRDWSHVYYFHVA